MLLHDNYIPFIVNLQAVVVFHLEVKCTNCIFCFKCISIMADSDKTLIGDGNLSNNNRKSSAPSTVPSATGTMYTDTHPTHHTATSEPSTLKRKQTSFQITSVTVKGSRLSTDGGEDSADDLDESHTEDLSSDILDCSRTTDIDNEQLSEESSNINNDESSVHAPSIPVKCKTELPVKQDAQNIADKFPSESSKDDKQIAPSESNQSQHVVNPPALPDQWQHRFRVVKIVSSEPFKRGRWLCMDFMDPPAPAVEAKPEVSESTTSSNTSFHDSVPTDRVAHIYEISPSDAYPGSISVAVGPDHIQQPMYGIFLPVNNGQYPFITGINTAAMTIQEEVKRPEPPQSVSNLTIQQSQLFTTSQTTFTEAQPPFPCQQTQVVTTTASQKPVQPSATVQVCPHQSQIPVKAPTPATTIQQSTVSTSVATAPIPTGALVTSVPVPTGAPVVSVPVATGAPVPVSVVTGAPVAPVPVVTTAAVASVPVVTAAPVAPVPIVTAPPVAAVPIAAAAPVVPVPVASAAPVPVATAVSVAPVPIAAGAPVVPVAVAASAASVLVAAAAPVAPVPVIAAAPVAPVPVATAASVAPVPTAAPIAPVPVPTATPIAPVPVPTVAPVVPVPAPTVVPVVPAPVSAVTPVSSIQSAIPPQPQATQESQPQVTQLTMQQRVQPPVVPQSHPVPVSTVQIPPVATSNVTLISSTSQASDVPQPVVNPPTQLVTSVSASQASSVGTQATAAVSNIPKVTSTANITVPEPTAVPSQVIQNHVEVQELGTPPSANPQPSQETSTEVPPVKSDINGEDPESVPSGTSTVAIDNKIEQAMDLVKSHLMFAVREEVDVLKEKITELMDRISQLEYENGFLRANASQQTLEQLNQTQLLQQQQQQNQPSTTVSMNSIQATQQPTPQQQLNIQNPQSTS